MYVFNHTGGSLQLDFTALGLQDIANESWGLNNVKVLVAPANSLTPYQAFIPVVVAR